jgi:2-polyprenyl-3-methyl-5-hydroxy-6-metoxy-1,4-benzoquinol methylase
VVDGKTDSDWEYFARQDPYWAVLSTEEFRLENLTDESLDRFFRSGATHIEQILDVLNSQFGVERRFETSLDFGCGVGRLLLPLAEISRTAVGLDVSPTMLDLCRKHAKERQVQNIELYRADDSLSAVQAYRNSIDLITSYIVFQHIPPRRGYQIFDHLLRLLRPGGLAFLHVTFASTMQSLQYEACNVSGSLYGYYQRTSDGLLKLVEHPAGDSQIQMNHYNLNDLLCRLSAHGISQLHLRLTNHSSTIGAEFYLRKPA